MPVINAVLLSLMVEERRHTFPRCFRFAQDDGWDFFRAAVSSRLSREGSRESRIDRPAARPFGNRLLQEMEPLGSPAQVRLKFSFHLRAQFRIGPRPREVPGIVIARLAQAVFERE